MTSVLATNNVDRNSNVMLDLFTQIDVGLNLGSKFVLRILSLLGGMDKDQDLCCPAANHLVPLFFNFFAESECFLSLMP